LWPPLEKRERERERERGKGPEARCRDLKCITRATSPDGAQILDFLKYPQQIWTIHISLILNVGDLDIWFLYVLFCIFPPKNKKPKRIRYWCGQGGPWGREEVWT
jgi:hypothetical protein